MAVCAGRLPAGLRVKEAAERRRRRTHSPPPDTHTLVRRPWPDASAPDARFAHGCAKSSKRAACFRNASGGISASFRWCAKRRT